MDQTSPPSQATSNEQAFSRLRWQCRRGMLELDYLLGEYFEACYKTLPEAQQGVFQRLLEEDDPTLFMWLIDHDDPTDADLRAMVQQIRAYAARPRR